MSLEFWTYLNENVWKSLIDLNANAATFREALHVNPAVIWIRLSSNKNTVDQNSLEFDPHIVIATLDLAVHMR